MSDVIKLGKARKAATRRAKADAADRNRAVHGRTRAEREAAARERARVAATLDGARREPGAAATPAVDADTARAAAIDSSAAPAHRATATPADARPSAPAGVLTFKPRGAT